MSQIKFLNENYVNSQTSSEQKKSKKFIYCSEHKINPTTINDNFEDEFVTNDILSNGCNSCSITENNKLFKSFINSKNNKNKELSLLYLINTFNKSYSNKSSEKDKLIIDFPKISKKLFSNSHIRHKSTTNINCQTFQKNLYIPKHSGKIINNFFSSIYSGNEFVNYTINPQKGGKNKGLNCNSGNQNCVISPFSRANHKFEKFCSKNISNCHLNYEFNLDIKEQKKSNKDIEKDNFCFSSLLDKVIVSDKSQK